jgi:hypothetical protein
MGMRAWLVVMMVAGVAGSARAECVPKGTPIFHVSSGPVHGAPDGTPPDWTTEVFANGAWTRRTGGATIGGCVDVEVLARLQEWIAKARFQFVVGKTCREEPTRIVIYEAPRRNKRVMMAWPCGRPLDEMTARAGACTAALATTADTVASECAPEPHGPP